MKIAIVDDDGNAIMNLSEAVTSAGHEAVGMHVGGWYGKNLDGVVADILREKPDFILLDHYLGEDCTGAQVAKHANVPLEKLIGTGTEKGNQPYCGKTLMEKGFSKSSPSRMKDVGFATLFQ